MKQYLGDNLEGDVMVSYLDGPPLSYLMKYYMPFPLASISKGGSNTSLIVVDATLKGDRESKNH